MLSPIPYKGAGKTPAPSAGVIQLARIADL